MNQAQRLANYLANGYHATRLTTAHQLSIANLTAVVANLRMKLGEASIVMRRKRDFKKQLYAEYYIPQERLRVLKEKRLVVPNGTGGFRVNLH